MCVSSARATTRRKLVTMAPSFVLPAIWQHLGRAKAGQVAEHGCTAQVAESVGLAQRAQVKTHHLAA